MSIAPAEVVRHFLRLEARRPKYSDRRDELLAWCELSDSAVMMNATRFANERDDVNPVFVYTGGITGDDRSSRVAAWSRERIKCGDIFAPSISPQMQDDINEVRGNILAFAQGPATKYSEFRPLVALCEVTGILIVVGHRVQGMVGEYEIIDGVHRLVALCRARIQETEAYVAHIK
jgi:hypothetical protein